MAKYLIDTNILSYLADPESEFHDAVFQKFTSLSEDDEVGLSILSLYELEYGISMVQNTSFMQKLLHLKKSILPVFSFLPLSSAGSEIFGKIKSIFQKESGISKKHLERHNVDFIILSSALEYDTILVSNDHIFTNLQKYGIQIKLENWAV